MFVFEFWKKTYFMYFNQVLNSNWVRLCCCCLLTCANTNKSSKYFHQQEQQTTEKTKTQCRTKTTFNLTNFYMSCFLCFLFIFFFFLNLMNKSACKSPSPKTENVYLPFDSSIWKFKPEIRTRTNHNHQARKI